MSTPRTAEAPWWGAGLLTRHAPDTPWARGRTAFTHGDLRARVADTARTLSSYGIGAGSTVVLRGAGGFTQIWTLLALWSRGAQVLLMGEAVRGEEFGRLLDRCRPQFYVSFDHTAGPGGAVADECEVLVRRMVGGRPAVTAHCLVQFTSGSTGFARPVGRTAASLLMELGRFRAMGAMPQRGERVLLLTPVTHSFGLVAGLLHALNTGAVVVLPSGTGPEAVLAACRAHAVAAVLGAPGHFAALAAGRGGRVAAPDLRLAVSAGDLLDADTHRRFADRFGVAVGQAYGTTETGIIASDPLGRRGPWTVGLPVPGVRVRLVSAEVRVRLDSSPYLAGEESPPRFLPDHGPSPGGWLCTRDLAEVDPATGSLRLLGRIDSLADRALLTAGATRLLLSDRTRVQRFDRDGRPAEGAAATRDRPQG